MTICIAALTKHGMSGGHIVTASDRLISNGDYFQGTDDALKARKLAKTWGLMFAGQACLFLPIWRDIQTTLGQSDGYDLATVQSAVRDAYARAFDSEFVAKCLARYSIASISQFRDSGLGQFGADKFHAICEAIDAFDLETDLLVYGFDSKRTPHVFTVTSPASVTDHDLLGYAVIGSGTFMASAALRRKPLPYHLAPMVYRLLEAKFSAETAAGVGENTALFTIDAAGVDKSIGYGSIDKLRAIWKAELALPEPKEATDLITALVGSGA